MKFLFSLLALVPWAWASASDRPAPSFFVEEKLYPITHKEPFRYKSPDAQKEDPNLQPFEDPRTGLKGYRNTQHKVVIAPQFAIARPFNKWTKIADVALKEGKYRWFKIDRTGKILYQSYPFDNEGDDYCRGLMRFIENDKIGFANESGKIVIPATFDFALPFLFDAPLTLVSKGCHAVKDGCHNRMEGGKWGVIDRDGRIVVPLEFDRYAFPHTEATPRRSVSAKPTLRGSVPTLTLYKGNQGFSLYQTAHGVTLVKAPLEEKLPPPSQRLCPVEYLYDPPESKATEEDEDPERILFRDPKTKLRGYQDSQGKTVIPPQFYNAMPFSRKFGTADVAKQDHQEFQGWFKINREGKILYKSYFFDNGPDYYVAGLMRWTDGKKGWANGKIGFADEYGKIVIPATFDFALPFFFNAPLTVVNIGGKEIPPKYCCDGDFVGGKWGAIDRQGNVVVPIEFDAYKAPMEFHEDSHRSYSSRTLKEPTLTFYKKGIPYRVYYHPESGKFVFPTGPKPVAYPSFLKAITP